MFVRRALIGLTLFAGLAGVPAGADERVEPSDRDVQRAVERGLFYVEATAVRWWSDEKCASCHDGPMLLLSHNVAKRRGFPIDQQKLDFWTERWMIPYGLVNRRKDGRLDAGGMLSAPLTLLFRDLERDVRPERAAALAQLVEIAGNDWQADDGSWDIAKIGLDYTPWMALALESLVDSEIAVEKAVRDAIRERHERTERWIRETERETPEKTEDVAAWLVFETRRGNTARAAVLLGELRRRRLVDGTWGMTAKSDKGHLIVTGSVLFALTSTGLGPDDPLVGSTRRLLLDRQREDGRWEEGGRIFDDGQDVENPVFNLWATALVCAALSQTIELPPGTKPAHTPDPTANALVQKMAAAAAEGYTGVVESSADMDAPESPADESPADEIPAPETDPGPTPAASIDSPR